MKFYIALFTFVLLTMTSDVIGYQGRFCDGNKILDTMQHVIKCNGRGKKCPAAGHPFIGFDATLSRLQRSIRRGQKIAFDSITVNEGKAYNKNGVFTCPVPGIYYFSWTILSFHGKDSDTLITVNRSKKRVNFSREYSGRHYYSGTTSVLLHLNKGDRVWIQMHGSTGNAHSGYSFFTGMLMRSD